MNIKCKAANPFFEAFGGKAVRPSPPSRHERLKRLLMTAQQNKGGEACHSKQEEKERADKS